MNYIKLLLATFFAFALFTACEPDFEEIPSVEEEGVFTDPNTGQTYSAGAVCRGGGQYEFSAALVPEPLPAPANVPTSFDLSAQLPPVRSQGTQSSCTSWAISYYLKSYQEGLEMSPAYTYNQIAVGNCGGTDMISTFSIIQERGLAPLADFPYDPDDCATQPDSAQLAAAEPYSIGEYFNLDSTDLVNQVKYRLLEGNPVVVSMVLDDQFGLQDSLGLAAYRPHEKPADEGICHAMLVVGYDDQYNAFKLVNSWGEDFGDNGFVWVDYLAFANASDPEAEFLVLNTAMIALREQFLHTQVLNTFFSDMPDLLEAEC